MMLSFLDVNEGAHPKEEYVGENPVHFLTVVRGSEIEALFMSTYSMFRLRKASLCFDILSHVFNEATRIKEMMRTYALFFVRWEKYV